MVNVLVGLLGCYKIYNIHRNESVRAVYSYNYGSGIGGICYTYDQISICVHFEIGHLKKIVGIGTDYALFLVRFLPHLLYVENLVFVGTFVLTFQFMISAVNLGLFLVLFKVFTRHNFQNVWNEY